MPSAAEPAAPLLELRAVAKTYARGGASVAALREVDLRVGHGEWVAVTGPSGSGKSTLLSILGLLDRPTAGEYRLQGENAAALDDRTASRLRNRSVGFVFQSFHLIPELTVLENVETPLLYGGAPEREWTDRARACLERVGLGHRADHRPAELSGGEAQRAAVARALVCEPALLLADEPTGNLDTVTGEQIAGLLEALNREGRTVVLVTHNEALAARSPRVVRLVDGRVVADESGMTPSRALLRLGLRGLLQHKLRSTLSILGVVFGVAAVVAMSSVGEGARREAVAQIGALGIDSITLRVRPAADARPAAGLSLRDAETVRLVVPGVVAVAPLREAPLPAVGENHVDGAVVVGTTPAYREAARLSLSSGRFLTDMDLSDGKRVVVLGATVADALFPMGDARGPRVQVGSDWFDVVGVLEARASGKGKAGPIRSRDVNRVLFVPLPALDRGGDARPDGVDEIVLRVAEADQVSRAAEVAQRAVERSSGGAALEVVVPREILRQKERTQRIFNVVTGAVAFIGLLVGGIGIMNIMLASVAERTREVGIRRALGATRADVAAQFLAESSLLTAAGGLAGALLGLVGSALIQRWAGWPTGLSPLMLLLSVVMALVVGIGFGLYPAWHAAHLEPMEALRN